MQFDRSSTTATASRGSRAPRRRQRALTRRHLPPLGLVPEHGRVGGDLAPSAGELVADLMALIDAGLVSVTVADDGTPHYAPAQPEVFLMENVVGLGAVSVDDPFAGAGAYGDGADGDGVDDDEARGGDDDRDELVDGGVAGHRVACRADGADGADRMRQIAVPARDTENDNDDWGSAA